MTAARWLVVLALAACRPFPDPRTPSTETLEHTPYGAWIVAIDGRGVETHGELIAVDRGTVYVWPQAGLVVALPRTEIREAQLYKYQPESFILAGATGLLQSPLQYFVTAPFWFFGTVIAEAKEIQHARMAYPGSSLDDMKVWSRFPFGLPATLDPKTLKPIAPPAASE